MRNMRNIFAVFLAVILLSACAEIQYGAHLWKTMSGPPTPQQGTFKVGKPYKVDGRWYHPKEQYDLVETGIASWYGPGFHGKRTANGERFDRNELTAAHRTLQMPSLVRVTNLENGRSLIVRVNDRGPFKRGRIIDVSERAAELLGFKERGTAKVRLEVLREESLRIAQAARTGADTSQYRLASASGVASEPVTAETLLTTPADTGPAHMQHVVPGHMRDGQFYPDPVVAEMPVQPSAIYVQAGAFSSYDNALRLRDRLSGYSQSNVYRAMVRGQPFFRVRLGPVASVEEADELLARLIASGHNEAIIVVE